MKVLRSSLAGGLAALALVVGSAGCGDSDSGGCGDGGCVDGGVDAGPPYWPTPGRYKVISYMEVSDGCGIDLGSLTNSSKPGDWIMIRLEGNTIAVGNDRGTPAQPSLGQGPVIGSTADLTRSNHVKNPDPSTCEYDDHVTARVTLDDPTGRTIGLSAREEQSNRSMCTEPAGVGSTCTSTWSWRLQPTGL
jgi:hypothetical protein